MTEDSTINMWAQQPGPINLRHTPRRDTRPHDLRAAEGIVLAVLAGGCIIVWTVAIIRWLTA